MFRTRGQGWALLLLALAALGVWMVLNARWARLPGGEDLATLWASARVLLFVPEGDPYGPLAAAYAQRTARAATPLPLLVPLYSLFPVFPLAWVRPFWVVRWIGLLAAQAAMGLALVLWPTLSRWRVRGPLLLIFVLSPVIWPFARWSLARGGGSWLALLVWLLVFTFLRHRRDDLAGGALALLSLDPLPHALAGLWVLVWAGSHGRWRVVRAFALTFAGLLLGAWWLRPHWWEGYLINVGREVIRGAWPQFPTWFAERLPGVGTRAGWTAAGIGALLLLVEMARSWAREDPHLAWVTALSLSLAPLLGVPLEPFSMGTLGLFVWWQVWSLWDKHWAYGRAVVAPMAGLWFGGMAWLAWQWGSDAAIPLAYLNAFVQVLALYTVRDWALRAESWSTWWI
ncbi:MAG: hypothetical protein GXO54_06320 [Chloroflexi bacterium]|nr:hypothetical protein [Chloroflexota bacterium]